MSGCLDCRSSKWTKLEEKHALWLCSSTYTSAASYTSMRGWGMRGKSGFFGKTFIITTVAILFGDFRPADIIQHCSILGLIIGLCVCFFYSFLRNFLADVFLSYFFLRHTSRLEWKFAETIFFLDYFHGILLLPNFPPDLSIFWPSFRWFFFSSIPNLAIVKIRRAEDETIGGKCFLSWQFV